MYIDVTLISVTLFGLLVIMLATLVLTKGSKNIKTAIISAVIVVVLLLNLVTVNSLTLLISLIILFYVATIRIGDKATATNLRLAICLSFILVAVTYTSLAPNSSTLKITTIEEKIPTPFQIVRAEETSTNVNGKETSAVKIVGAKGEEMVLPECNIIKRGTGISYYIKEKTMSYKNLYTIGKYIVRILEGKTYQAVVYLK